MIECVLGLLVGWFAGRPLFHHAMGLGGVTAAIIFLALLDELCAVVADKQHNIFSSSIMKAVFIIIVVWVGERTGTPLAVFAELILLASVFRRSVTKAGRGKNGLARV